ncbi:hypothetical protein IFM89_029860 [Coptis chinensis]|uniref:F-box domain-containing protein n=1 Tax=Coptis chinensis TaxID=261450 RepID=A0A835LX09_9MAGN|nr:hypothetical protein IFM89_029860 [Coptis chinensis]
MTSSGKIINDRMPNIDLEIIPSQMGFLKGMKSGIVGRTGSGKSRLKQTVLCLDEPTAARHILLIKEVRYHPLDFYTASLTLPSSLRILLISTGTSSYVYLLDHVNQISFEFFTSCPSVYSLIAFRILALICCVGFGQGHLPRLLDCFLTFGGYTRLLIFDMDDGTITISLPCGRKFGYLEGPFWVMPNCEPQVKKEVPKVGNYKTEIIKESWNDLPAELLELVISSLFLGDCIRFRLTCKSLIFITPQMRPNPPLTQCESRCQRIPWLMSLQKNNSD